MSLLYCALLGGNTEWRIRRPVSSVSVSPLDDLEEEPVAVGPAVKLKIFSLLVAVIEDAQGAQPEKNLPASVLSFSAPFKVSRNALPSLSITWLRTTPPGSMTSTTGDLYVRKMER